MDVVHILRQQYEISLEVLKRRRKKKKLIKAHLLLQLLDGYRVTIKSKDLWAQLQQNWEHFFWLSGETPHSLSNLVIGMHEKFFHHFHNTRGRKLDLKNQILLTMIWLRNYPSMQTLATIFGVHVSTVHRIIHDFVKLLHTYLVPKYVRWHSMGHWRNLAGIYPEWPTVVAILDCTPLRINKPTGAIQRIFYRYDRHCHFLNWLVIVDALGYVVYSRPGFIGRTNDSACLRNVTLPVLPRGLHIMADQGFRHKYPVIVLPRANQPQISTEMRRSFKSRRSMIERCFGILKSSYSSVASRYRSRRHNAPLLCNLCCALYNRRKLIFSQIRDDTGLKFMP